MPASLPRLSACILFSLLLVPAIARPAAPPAPPAAPAAKTPQRPLEDVPRYWGGRPGGPESSVRYTYHGQCAGHVVDVAWEQVSRLRYDPASQQNKSHYELDSLSVQTDGDILDPISTSKLMHFLENAVERLSKSRWGHPYYRIISSVSTLCWQNIDSLNLVFYYSFPAQDVVFGYATASLSALRAELTEGEGPDPLDGKPPLPPLDADGHRPKIRYPWGGWRDADLPK